LFNYHPSLKLLILEGVLDRLNGLFVPMGKRLEDSVYIEITDTIMSPDWEKSDIF